MTPTNNDGRTNDDESVVVSEMRKTIETKDERIRALEAEIIKMRRGEGSVGGEENGGGEEGEGRKGGERQERGGEKNRGRREEGK